MIHGIGVDIVKTARLQNSLKSAKFVNNTFTEREIQLADSRSSQSRYFAKVFAAKEAVFKALRIDSQQLKSWKQIEILDSKLGYPEVKLHGDLKQFTRNQQLAEIFVSVSYETDYAIANAIITKKGSL